MVEPGTSSPATRSGATRSGVLVAAALVAFALGGCRLIDQRTFERTGAAPSAAELARSAQLASRPTPIVTVFPGRADEQWRPLVLGAVRDALVRRPDAAFDIVSAVPTRADAAAQRQAVETGSADAADVAATIEADGVAADKLHIGARGDAGTPGREVMVYLR